MEAVLTTVIAAAVVGALGFPFAYGYQHPRLARKLVDAYLNAFWYFALGSGMFLLGFVVGRAEVRSVFEAEGETGAQAILAKIPDWLGWILIFEIAALVYSVALILFMWLVVWPLADHEVKRDLDQRAGR